MIVADAGYTGIKGISGKKGWTLLSVYKNAAGGGGRLLAPVFNVGGTAGTRAGIAPDFVLTAVDAAALYFAPETDGASINAALKEKLAAAGAERINITGGITLIAVVGGDVGIDANTAAKIAGALAEAGIKSYGSCFVVSETNITVGVADKDYEAALRAIYAKLA
jgi:aspartate kinase